MHRPFALILILFLLHLKEACAVESAPPTIGPKPPGVWMTHMRLQELAEDPAQWDFTRKHLEAVEIYINVVAFLCPAEEMKKLLTVLKENHIKIAIECGYFDWDNNSENFTDPNPKRINDTVRQVFDDKTGEKTAQIEMKKLALLFQNGCVPDYLNLDGPVRRMLYPGEDVGKVHDKGFHSIETCVDELVDYMRTWNKAYPSIRFFVLTNFPNWGWKGEPAYWGDRQDGMHWGDYHEVLKCILRKAKESGLPLCGVTADNPYEYAIGTHPVSQLPDPKKINWLGRLLDLERVVEKHGLEFNMIINSEGGGIASSEAFYNGSMNYLETYLKSGATPSRLIFQSWYKAPEKVVPESEPFTMTHLVKKALEKLQGTIK